MKHVSLVKTSPKEIAGLIQEVVDTGAFLERTADDEPFVVEAASLFADEPDFHIFALVGEDSQPVGFAMVLPSVAAETLEIGPTYVTSVLRGQGLGTQMLARVVGWARERGVRRLVVATWGENTRARHVFQSLGFRLTGEDLDARVNGDTTVHFALDLMR